jgi:alpha-beta hydrolase superfamily lysophospholipase
MPGSPLHHHLPYPHESSFNYGQHVLNYYASHSSDSPTAIAVFLHGLYGYGGNSGYLAVNMTKHIPGLNFYSLDFLNFGKSKGDCRGYISSF